MRRKSAALARRKSVPSTLGPIPVRYKAGVKAGDEVVLGKFSFMTRRITVDKRMPDIAIDQALWHEWIHTVLWDTGTHNNLSKQQEEQICDALGTALASWAQFKPGV